MLADAVFFTRARRTARTDDGRVFLRALGNPADIQDLGDAIPKLLELKAKASLALRFQVRIEVGDGTELPTPEVSAEVNKLLGEIKEGYEVR